MNKYAIGKNIKLYCRMQNKTLDQLAEEIGVSRDTMSRWCNGHRQITSHGLYRVSRALRVPMERLMEGIEDKLPSAQPAFDARDTQYNLPIGKDLISRAEAIDTLENTKTAISENGERYIAKQNAIMRIDALPSAEPEPIRINLNEPIKVKLTDWGKEIYYHQYDRANQIAGREICKPKFPKEDENGYTEFQLWCFMELYGEHMGMTLPNVIEPLEIVYERRTG